MRALAIILMSFISAGAFAQNDGFTKGQKGIEYKIISSGSGELIKKGDYAAIYFQSVYRGEEDTVLNDSHEAGVPQIFEVISTADTSDSTANNSFGGGIPPEFYNVFLQLKSGDSVSIRLLADSAFKEYPESMPSFIAKGHYLFTNLKIEKIYTAYADAVAAKTAFETDAAVFSAAKAKQQAQVDEIRLKQYFAAHRILLPKQTPNGAYIVMKSPGIGLPIDKRCVVKINYTGSNLAGEVFDSNTDASKGHTAPLTVNLTDNPDNGASVITGLSDALLMMKDKSKATIYIPSGLAYGNRSMGAALGANENLIFDVEILSVKRIPAKGKAVPAKKAITKKPIKHR